MARRVAGVWRRGARKARPEDAPKRSADNEHESEDNSDNGVEEDAPLESPVEPDSDEGDEGAAKPTALPARLALIFGVIAVAVLGAGAGWFGYRAHQDREAAQTRATLIQVAKQGALNLTTIDFHHADADVQQILNSSTGTFLNDFQARSAGFVDFVKKVQSKSFGTIVAAGMEAQSGNEARVLVQLAVTTSTAGAPPDPTPRSWRMRITVTKDRDSAKISNVEFVP